jgi:hypothetical protein
MRLCGITLLAFDPDIKKACVTMVFLTTDTDDERALRQEVVRRLYEKYPKPKFESHDYSVVEVPYSLIKTVYESPPDDMDVSVDDDIWGDIDLGLLPV